MTHPWALTAIADLDALKASWTALAAARVRVAHIALEEAAPVQAWRPRVQVSGGGGPSETPTVVEGGAAYAELAYIQDLEGRASHAVDQTRWIILDALGILPESWDTTRTLYAHLPANAARSCTAWLRPPDQTIRKALHLGDDLTLAPGNPDCPVCTVRLIRQRPASGLIVCDAGCRCTGDTCPCRMPVRDRGAPHIWTELP